MPDSSVKNLIPQSSSDSSLTIEEEDTKEKAIRKFETESELFNVGKTSPYEDKEV